MRRQTPPPEVAKALELKCLRPDTSMVGSADNCQYTKAIFYGKYKWTKQADKVPSKIGSFDFYNPPPTSRQICQKRQFPDSSRAARLGKTACELKTANCTGHCFGMALASCSGVY